MYEPLLNILSNEVASFENFMFATKHVSTVRLKIWTIDRGKHRIIVINTYSKGLNFEL